MEGDGWALDALGMYVIYAMEILEKENLYDESKQKYDVSWKRVQSWFLGENPYKVVGDANILVDLRKTFNDDDYK
jgi:hypothetical protein